MIRRVPIIRLCMILLWIAGTATVAAGQSSDSPATMPSTGPAGSDSPQSGLKAYNAAIASGDFDAMLARVHVMRPEEDRIARAMVRSDLYVSKLLKAAREKFGADAAAKLARVVGDVSDTEIDAAITRIDGDHATIDFGRGAYAMVKVDGIWKVDAAAIRREIGPKVEVAIDRIASIGSRADALTADIRAGKYQSIDQVIQQFSKTAAAGGK